MSSIAHADRAHALISASAAKRWINCPPSALLNDAIMDVSSASSEEGTKAHELSEIMIRLAILPVGSKEVVDYAAQASAIRAELGDREYKSMVANLGDYVEEATTDFMLGADVRIESKLDLRHIAKESFGTGDLVSYYAAEKLKIVDLKYGFYRVSPVMNEQLLMYASGAIESLGLHNESDLEVELVIHQPRAGGRTSWATTVKEVNDWAESVKPIAELAYTGGGERKAGEWCKFCKVKYTCTAPASIVQASIDFAAENVSVVTSDEAKAFANEVTLAKLAEIWSNREFITEWLKGVGELLEAKLREGHAIPGVALVTRKGRRAWLDEDEAIGILVGNGYELEDIAAVKLKGLTEITKLVGKSFFSKNLSNVVSNAKTYEKLVPSTELEENKSSAEIDFEN